MNWDKTIDQFKIYLKLERNLSENTIENYLRDIHKFKKFNENIALQNIEREHVELFNFNLAKNYNSRSQARIMSGVRSFFQFLQIEEIKENNPTQLIELPKLERKLPDTLSLQEINKIIAAIDLSDPNGERNRAIIETLYGCGLRVSELINLKISDIYFDEDFVSIIGKGNKQRLVPMAKFTQKIIKIYLNQVRVKQTVKARYSDFVFLNNRGKNLTRVMIFTLIKKYVELAGIKKNISPHTFRHSFATHLLENGANLRSIQLMLGHESITTTEIYTHLDKKHLRQTIEKFHPRS